MSPAALYFEAMKARWLLTLAGRLDPVDGIAARAGMRVVADRGALR